LDIEKNIAGLNSITFVKSNLNDLDKYKFILLFNSKFFSYLYELFYESTRTHSNLRFKEIYLSEIPIFDLNNLDSVYCKDLFIKITNLIKEKNINENNFIKLLKSEFKDIKITNKLDSWYLLSFIEFMQELKKQKIDLKLKQKNDWILYFEEEKKLINPILEQLNYTDKLIDNQIYKLYNLSSEEINVIENAK